MQSRLDVIKNLPFWKGRTLFIEKLSGGMTNFNYTVWDGDDKYIARFAPQSNVFLGLDRMREVYNTKVAHSLGFGPDVVQVFPEYGLLLVEYIEGKVLSSDTVIQPVLITSVAKILKKLHNGPKFSGKYHPFEAMREQVAVVRRKRSWLPENIDELLKELDRVEITLGKFYDTYPCHLDLMLENIIEDGNQVKLIDWEYSSNSDYRLDLAMFSVKGNLTSEQEELLLKEYGDNGKDLHNQILLMKSVVYFREAVWGLLQLAVSDIEFDYKKYAVKNLELFTSLRGTSG